MGVEKSETLAVRVRQGLTEDDHKEMLCGNEMSCISFVVFPYVTVPWNIDEFLPCVQSLVQRFCDSPKCALGLLVVWTAFLQHDIYSPP